MKNNEYLSNQWEKTLSFILALVLFMIMGVIINPSIRIPVIFGVAFAAAMTFSVRKKAKNLIEKYFKNESPDKLLNYFENSLNRSKKLQDKEVWICYNKSLVCCYYGEFDRAIEFLGEIDWNDKVPYLQSLEISIKALIYYLKGDNYGEGLRLSIIAQRLGEVSGNYPGVSKSRDFFDTYIQIGELLSGNYSSKVIDNLEEKFKKSPLFLNILIAWCLSNVYTKMSTEEKAITMRDYCEKTVPHCKPLLRIN